MVGPLIRIPLENRSHHGRSQVASLGAGANQKSIYITRDEMETMMDAMEERMLKRQKEMMQNLQTNWEGWSHRSWLNEEPNNWNDRNYRSYGSRS